MMCQVPLAEIETIFSARPGTNTVEDHVKNARVGSRSLAMLGAVIGLALGAGSLQATVVTWTNTAGSWDLAGNWNPAQVPTSGDEVVITNAGASVLLAGASSNLATLTLGGTLTFR